MTVIEEIAAERARQVAEEGWTTEHDDDHSRGEMAEAAAAYAWWSAVPEFRRSRTDIDDDSHVAWHLRRIWPEQWERYWFKPSTPRRDLIKAAALIVADIERLDRATQRSMTTPDSSTIGG